MIVGFGYVQSLFVCLLITCTELLRIGVSECEKLLTKNITNALWVHRVISNVH